MFLLFFCSPAKGLPVDIDASLRELAASDKWHRLLQLKSGKPINTNTDLYLSQAASPYEEVVLTYQLLLSKHPTSCRYPARARLIAAALDIGLSVLHTAECQEYQSFLDNFPVDSVYLIYTSENVTQASSMMGHVMLRADGVNKDGLEVQHGITFFTELEGLNVPKIMWQSLVTGKAGIFQIAPYAPFVAHYVNEEQRNVYEYPINIDKQDRLLLRDIIWEFGRTQAAYYFHTYNCATLTQAMLGVLEPTMMPSAGDWITPLDVVKAAKEADVLQDASLRPSVEWRIKLLSRLIPSSRKKSLVTELKADVFPTIEKDSGKQQAFEFHYVKAYLDFMNAMGSAPREKQNNIINSLNERFPELAESFIDVGDFKNPLNTPNDGQLHLGLTYQNVDSEAAITFRLFPVNNTIYDDNRNFYGENVLILSDLQFRIEHDSDLLIDHFTIYNMQTINDFDSEFRRFSSAFYVGVDRIYQRNGDRKLSGIVRGGIGVSKVFSTNFGIYSLFQVSSGFRADAFIMAEPELGAYVYYKDYKLVTKGIARYNAFNNRDWTYDTEISLISFLNSNVSVSANVGIFSGLKKQVQEVSLNVHYGF
ncbi:DUF4105 domain-containing protein [Glaciecola sp. SC05]|uniref:lipoprotein N-acyltransferase Lnb domain-containing protein n=1 Tax=Glaciecola sp. SC05 TaxID=1987355 RepID=UPI0035285D1B